MGAGGASPSIQAVIQTPRPRWADLCEEEEEKYKNANVVSDAVSYGWRQLENADDASGAGENKVSYLGAQAANKLKASEGCNRRDKFWQQFV